MRNFSIHLLKFQYLEICQLYSSLKKLSCTDCLCSYLHTTRPIIIVPQFGFLEATELVLSCTIGFPISRRAMKVVCIIFFCSGWLGILGFVSPSVFFFVFFLEGGVWWFKFSAPRFRFWASCLRWVVAQFIIVKSYTLVIEFSISVEGVSTFKFEFERSTTYII